MTREINLEQKNQHFEVAMPESERWVFQSQGVPSYSPLESVVAAAGACGGYVYQDILTRSKVGAAVELVRVVYATKPGPAVHALTALTLHFEVSCQTQTDAKKAERYVKFVHRYCPVIQSLNADIVVTDIVHATVVA